MKKLDYEELECSNCGHVGLLPNGGFDTICPNCGFEDSLIEEPEESRDEELEDEEPENEGAI